MEFYQNMMSFKRDMSLMKKVIQANGVVLDDSEIQGNVLSLGVWLKMLSLIVGRFDINDMISLLDPNA